jgi:hypothetical protein
VGRGCVEFRTAESTEDAEYAEGAEFSVLSVSSALSAVQTVMLIDNGEITRVFEPEGSNFKDFQDNNTIIL